MKKLKYLSLLSIILLHSSCRNQHQKQSLNKETSVVKAANETAAFYAYGAGDIVTKGLIDKEGNIWFTTTKEGVFKYNGKTFKNFTTKDGLCSNNVWSVIEDNNAVLWFATAKGLCSFDGNNFTNILLPKGDSEERSPLTGLPSRQTNVASTIIQDNNGDFWIGTDASGAFHYDGNKFTSFLKFKGRIQPSDSVYNNCITSILEDRKGNIWFTSMTHGGISRYDGKDMTHFTTEDGLLGDMIKPSFEDSKGRIWFGSIQNLEGGINIFDGTSFKSLTTKDGLCDSNVACFFEDETGRIWIGTGDGVCYYDGATFTEFTKKGESFGDIRFITKDNEGNMWLGGRYGSLYRYNGKELQNFTLTKRTR